MLRLEITESVLIAEGSRVRTVIDSLGDLGVKLSLDDFGTGYSPLSYLRELPVTEIKIDRSFVEAMMSDRDTATIVAAVIGLARRLGIEVVAEGIETAGQLEMLRSFDARSRRATCSAARCPPRWSGAGCGRTRSRTSPRRCSRPTRSDGGRAALESRLERGASAGALVWPGPGGRAGARRR